MFIRDLENKLLPVNPPVAHRYKYKVKRAEARVARKLFKPVVVYIDTFCAAFQEAEKPDMPAPLPLATISTNQQLSDGDAAALAWQHMVEHYTYTGYSTSGGATYKRTWQAGASKYRFWRAVYRDLGLVEKIATELPYGEVSE